MLCSHCGLARYYYPLSEMDPCFCSFGGVRNELITELDVAESMNTSLINLQEANSNRMLFVQSLLRCAQLTGW